MKTVFLGQVCAPGWAWVHSEVRCFVAKTSGCLGMGDLGGGFCCTHLKGTVFHQREISKEFISRAMGS